MWSVKNEKYNKIQKSSTFWYHHTAPHLIKGDQSLATAIHLNVSPLVAHHLISYSLANVTGWDGCDSGRVSGEGWWVTWSSLIFTNADWISEISCRKTSVSYQKIIFYKQSHYSTTTINCKRKSDKINWTVCFTVDLPNWWKTCFSEFANFMFNNFFRKHLQIFKILRYFCHFNRHTVTKWASLRSSLWVLCETLRRKWKY